MFVQHTRYKAAEASVVFSSWNLQTRDRSP